MPEKSYAIRYGPPVNVKDRPHRRADTARSEQESVDNEAMLIGEVSVIGGFAGLEIIESTRSLTEQTETCTIG